MLLAVPKDRHPLEQKLGAPRTVRDSLEGRERFHIINKLVLIVKSTHVWAP
jgi:hypothetical protein